MFGSVFHLTKSTQPANQQPEEQNSAEWIRANEQTNQSKPAQPLEIQAMIQTFETYIIPCCFILDKWKNTKNSRRPNIIVIRRFFLWRDRFSFGVKMCENEKKKRC